jgi:hypothetical protein
MTKREKILIGILKSSKVFSNLADKEIAKYLHTVNPTFENLSPFDWEQRYGNKKLKIKIKNHNEKQHK